MAELPQLVQLQQQNPDRLHVITLNVDFDDEGQPSAELQESVKSMLARQNVSVETVMSTDHFDAVLEEFHIFSLPAALLYDPDGNLAKKFEGVFEYESDVGPLIE